MSKPFVIIGGGLWQRGSAGWKWAKKHLVAHKRKVRRRLSPLPFAGCDYVSGPSAAALKAAKIKFVCRYLSTPGNPKNATAAEISALHAAGIDVVLVFETVANRALGGKAAGAADAKSAQAQVAALGFPNAVIYLVVDFDPHGHETMIVSYIAAAAGVLSPTRTGVYGGLAAVKACLDAKACKYAWQTYAWSAGQWDPRRHLEQYQNGQHIGGASVDLDRARQRSFGAL